VNHLARQDKALGLLKEILQPGVKGAPLEALLVNLVTTLLPLPIPAEEVAPEVCDHCGHRMSIHSENHGDILYCRADGCDCRDGEVAYPICCGACAHPMMMHTRSNGPNTTCMMEGCACLGLALPVGPDRGVEEASDTLKAIERVFGNAQVFDNAKSLVEKAQIAMRGGERSHELEAVVRRLEGRLVQMQKDLDTARAHAATLADRLQLDPVTTGVIAQVRSYSRTESATLIHSIENGHSLRADVWHHAVTGYRISVLRLKLDASGAPASWHEVHTEPAGRDGEAAFQHARELLKSPL
jgi:hypothetical protein